MKKQLLIAVSALIIAVPVLAEELTTSPQQEGSTLGITAGAEYWSNYLWRGTSLYGSDGAFFPYVSYDVMGSGVEIGAGAEISESWVGDGDDTYEDGHAVSIGIDYGYTISDMVTVGASVWYFRLKDDSYSFVSGTVFLTMETMLSPTVYYTHDYYTDTEDKEDFYVQFGVSHEIGLSPSSGVEFGLIGGYYRAESADSKGVSDIEFSISPSIEVGNATIYSGLSFVYIPSKDFYQSETGDDDKFRFYAVFGSSYTF